jgi:hypothetical protein
MTTATRERVAFVIQVRELNTNKIVATQQMSADAGRLLRHQKAEYLAKRYSDPRDCYAVELEKLAGEPKGHPGSVIDKYELGF